MAKQPTELSDVRKLFGNEDVDADKIKNKKNVSVSRNDEKKSNNSREQKDNHNKQSYGGTSNQNSNKKKYVGAPYNFVSFSQKVYSYKDEDLHAHNEVSEKLHMRNFLSDYRKNSDFCR